MTNQRKSPISLSSNAKGFSVVGCPEIRIAATNAVIRHIQASTRSIFASLEEAADHIVEKCFDSFKDKDSRILPSDLANSFQEFFYSSGYISQKAGEYITDEEHLGYPNIYWRIVRANSASDVGPIHADRWFWDLNKEPFPITHQRVKVWMPLMQDDACPSLMLIPGSHANSYQYGSRSDASGKIKPTFIDETVAKQLDPAPVKVGEAVFFNDDLLHVGRTTEATRISLEFTLACVIDIPFDSSNSSEKSSQSDR
jgi:hypothetical protein